MDYILLKNMSTYNSGGIMQCLGEKSDAIQLLNKCDKECVCVKKITRHDAIDAHKQV